MRPVLPALALIALLAAPASARQAAQAPALPGFTPATSAAQRALEAAFLAVPSAEGAARTVRDLAREPHLAGTPGGRAVAERLAADLERLGFAVRLERYDVYLPHPRAVRAALLAPERRALEMREPDRAGAADPDLLRAWNAYSANGSVEAPVVYANFGLPEDYEELERLGVDVRGRIVLARYGRSFRGVKVRVAEERGAAGVLLFSDPSGDGYAAGDTLPRGPWRPGWARERRGCASRSSRTTRSARSGT